MKLIDRYYKKLRPFRFLWGWAVDGTSRLQSSARAKEWRRKGFRGAKLDICGGRNPVGPDFLNVDIVPFPRVDLAFDITKRFPLEDNVIAEIFSAATLEHLRRPHVDHVLREFFRVLKPGGIVQVSTPDMEAIARHILAGADVETINQYMLGRYKSEETEIFDLHKWMYPAAGMIAQLKKIGFIDAKKIDWDGMGLQDPEWNYLIRARKPG